MATQPQTDEFSAAFDSFVAPPSADTPQEVTPVDEETPPTEAPPAEAPAEEAPPAETTSTEAPPAEAPAEEVPPAETPAPVEAPSATDELIGRLTEVLQERQQPPAETPPAETPTDIYTPEEREFMQTYESDWKDVSRGEELKRRSEYRQLVGFVFNQVASQFQPLLEAVDVLSSRAQLTDLRTRVNDYDDVRDQVVDWVGKQPQYLQTAYNSVIQSGTVDEVADLIDRFRKESGAAPVAAPVTEPKKAELSDDTKKAVKALAPVSTKRSAVPQAEDAGDFDAAFSRFAEVLKR